jgi:hypothetical protein
MADMMEERLARLLEEHLNEMPSAARIAKFRELASTSPADKSRMQAIFPELYREAFPPPSPVAGGPTESTPHVGLFAKPR